MIDCDQNLKENDLDLKKLCIMYNRFRLLLMLIFTSFAGFCEIVFTNSEHF